MSASGFKDMKRIFEIEFSTLLDNYKYLAKDIDKACSWMPENLLYIDLQLKINKSMMHTS
jgi:hypothetical protein